MPSTVEQWLQNRRLAAIEEGGEGGVHPNLNAHDALGLATDAALAAHAGDGGLHSGSHPNLAVHDALGLVTEADLAVHADDEDLHGGTHPDLTVHDALGLVPDTLIAASGMGTVIHGATAGTARPSGFAAIHWIGTVEPSNAVDGDIWTDTDEEPGEASHPDLTEHNTLGLATQAELDAHAATAHAGDHPDGDHATLATSASVTSAVSTHAGLADPHTGYRLESASIQTADIANLAVTAAKVAADVATQAELDAVAAAKANTAHAHDGGSA